MTERREPWTQDEAIDILIEIARDSRNDAARIAAIKRLNEIDAVTRTTEDDIYPPDELTRKRSSRGRGKAR
jgi:hypothetical protein